MRRQDDARLNVLICISIWLSVMVQTGSLWAGLETTAGLAICLVIGAYLSGR